MKITWRNNACLIFLFNIICLATLNAKEPRIDEFLIDTNFVYISAAQRYEIPKAAFDGTNYFIVWTEYHSDRRDIYGARVSQSGVVLDSVAIAISTASENQAHSSIAFDGTNYFVVWMDNRNDSEYYDIYGARVSQTGVVLDSAGIAISTALDDQSLPSITFDGTNYFVVWEDQCSGPTRNIYGARVSPTGTVLDPGGIVISNTEEHSWDPTVAFDGTNYFVVWQETVSSGNQGDIYGARVSQSGVVLDSVAIAVSADTCLQDCPSIAFDGTNYLVVWWDRRSGTNCDIYGARVSQTGVVLDSAGIAIITALDDQSLPSITFDGTNYFVVWEDQRSAPNHNIYGARVSQTGTVLDSAGITISTVSHGRVPCALFGSTNYFVVWQDLRRYPDYTGTIHWGQYDIYGARVSQSGVLLDSAGIAISTAMKDQCYPAIAFDGTNYLVAWDDNRNSSYFDIYCARISPTGTVLDTAGIRISPLSYHQRLPAIVFDGTNYVVVWENYDWAGPWRIHGAKVNLAGIVVDSFIVTPTQQYNQFSSAIAHGTGDTLLIAYTCLCDYFNDQPIFKSRTWGQFYYPFIGIEENIPSRSQDAILGFCSYPNPFNTALNVEYVLPRKGTVCISLFDVSGRLVRELINENQNAGVFQRRFETYDLTQGVYFIKIDADNHSEVRKIIHIR